MVKQYVNYLFIGICLLSCSQDLNPDKSPKEDTQTAAGSGYLYVAAGQCYSGGNTTFSTTTASNIVYRINLLNGTRDITVADYNAFPASAGDSPVGLVNWDAENVLVLIENSTAGRRIEKVPKRQSADRSVFTTSTAILSGVLRGLLKTSDGGLLVSKSTSIEKISSSGVRIGAPYIGANLGATCGTATTLMSSISTLTNGKVIFTHAAASNNRLGIISSSGYMAATDCLAAQAAPTATSFPTASVYLPEYKQLIVAYAGTTVGTGVNSVYVYDIDETANTISNATKIYDASLFPGTYSYLLYGISSMAYDSKTGSLYVATSTTTATTVPNYVIEKLSYDAAAKTLTRGLSSPFYNYGVDTKCISAIFVDSN